ncbi:tubulin-tyrosine ligase, variant [Thecamonas trahens ATCC 50062]|uniref:Tubulin-tyrosine ligase n=1 Tax=Thecamonas trahens ATCC 50062 TaxID=461836 RepID=A0A0L0DM10_THETB|nr:tubulin-tyrosine ligase [Thecamonas trahens ATCC 50062]XP_013754406.1 tubulin-tyrosine ligase, variant [Thecamonas trahens ATCC 50062]KNC53359.1 tubulin-tyrosine ligase, variant [Thecamonas trahens ATCC 50062]KNC53360.1 tubulin-tyrosine ligase [Thecamonas trahens ATCC 50062]|eukprot:XP_013754405.1 tubulin-tyrosine ligase [Thecamonas trahens ATCC 50062]
MPYQCRAQCGADSGQALAPMAHLSSHTPLRVAIGCDLMTRYLQASRARPALVLVLALAMAAAAAAGKDTAGGASRAVPRGWNGTGRKYVVEQVASNHTLVAAALAQRGWLPCPPRRFGRGCRAAALKWTWSPERFASEPEGRVLNHFHTAAVMTHKDLLAEALLATHGEDAAWELLPRSYIVRAPLPTGEDDDEGSVNGETVDDDGEALLAALTGPDATATTDDPLSGDSCLAGASVPDVAGGGEVRADGGGDGGGAERKVWIVKPAAAARGVGIELFDDGAALVEFVNREFARSHAEAAFVVQEYVGNPLVIRGKKFDIRQFVLVTSLNPLTVFVLDDAYLRFSTEDYTLDNLDDRFIHLTNHQVQKDSASYASSGIPGNQWSLAQLTAHLAAEYPDTPQLSPTALRANMIDLVVKTLDAWGPDGHRERSFELLGFDVLVDETGKLWLLEVNISPGLHLTTDIVRAHHSHAIESLFQVVLDDSQTAFPSPSAHASLSPDERAAAAAVRAAAILPCSSATSSPLPPCEIKVGGWELVRRGEYDAAAATAASGAFAEFQASSASLSISSMS